MIKHFILVFFLFGLECLSAQSRWDALLNIDPVFATALDSLHAGRARSAIAILNETGAQFKQEEKWTKYVGSLIVLGKVYFEQKQLDSTLLVLQKALDVAQQKGNERLAANTEEGIARVYMAKQDSRLAMQHYRNFAQWCLADGKPKAKVQTCVQLVQIFTKAVNPDSIFKYLRLGLSLTKGHDFPILTYKLNQMAGLGWNNLNKPDSALHYFRQNLALLPDKPDQEARKVNAYLNITHVFLENHNPQRARKYLALAQKAAQQKSLPFSSAMIIFYEGRILAAEKKPETAIATLEKALKAFKKLPNPERHPLMQARCLKALAEAYHEQGEADRALAYLRQSKAMNVNIFQRYNEMQNELVEAAILSEQDAISASDELLMENLVWAKKSANLIYQIKVYETLAANARKKKDLEKALAYNEKAQALEEQLDPVLQANKLSNAEMNLEVGERDQSIQRLQVANFRKTKYLQNSRVQAGILALALLLLTVVGVRIYRRKRQQAARLQLEKQQVEASLQEKELLLKEIHHRVKNNMQVISSLLNLQSRTVQDPVALKVMREGRDRVRSMALIHQTLYQNNDFSNVETEDYFLKLAENLFHTYNIDQDRVHLVANIQPLKFNVDIMIALGLILNELISNTLKYAFPEEQSGEVRISLVTHSDQVELKVEDNGVGFPANFVPDNSRSIGFSLIHAFTQKLGGSLQINNAEKGARASLIFPLKNAILSLG